MLDDSDVDMSTSCSAPDVTLRLLTSRTCYLMEIVDDPAARIGRNPGAWLSFPIIVNCDGRKKKDESLILLPVQPLLRFITMLPVKSRLLLDSWCVSAFLGVLGFLGVCLGLVRGLMFVPRHSALQLPSA